MSFKNVNSVEERKALVNQYLKICEILKKRVVDEKVGKQTFQRDVADELKEPEFDQQKILEEQPQQKRTDQRQCELIAKLQQNHEAIIEKLDDQEAAVVQTLLAQQ